MATEAMELRRPQRFGLGTSAEAAMTHRLSRRGFVVDFIVGVALWGAVLVFGAFFGLGRQMPQMTMPWSSAGPSRGGVRRCPLKA